MGKRVKVREVKRSEKPLIPIRNVVVLNDHNVSSTHKDKRFKPPKHKGIMYE